MNKILIIDDDLVTRTLLLGVLESAGYAVLQAEDGKLGLQAARENPVDLVVCDIMMPELDGFEVLEKLRDSVRGSLIPFIFLTCRGARDDLRHGMNLGADDYLTKPVQPEELLTVIRKRLERRAGELEEGRRQAETVSLSLAAAIPREITEPIAQIETLAGLMLATSDTADNTVKGLHRGVTRATARLRRLIARLNLYAELPQLYSQRFNLAADSASAANGAAVVARESHSAAGRWECESSLETTLAPGPVGMREHLLSVVAYELVDNACKFGTPGRPVRIRVTTEPAAWMLQVQNEGAALSPEEILSLSDFKRYWAGSAKPSGIGLGLVLVQGIVRLHGGETVIQSLPGEGVCVQVLVPNP